jgi:hypothetical protein
LTVTAWKKLVLLFIAIYAVLFSWAFTQNLTLNTDYPFHLHNIWALTRGHFGLNPFIGGGSRLTLTYGGPPLLLGALLYPILGVYTVAVLMLLALPLLWHFSLRVFHKLTTRRIAKYAVLVALLNPLTLNFFLAAKMPFLWGTVFGMASLGFYLERKPALAALTGVLAIITHPLSVFLLAAILLLKFNPVDWLKVYLPVCVVVALQALFLFGIPGIGGGGETLHIPKTVFLTGTLVALIVIRRNSRVPCALSLLVLASAVVAALFGATIPSVYFERIAWFVLLVSAPFLVKLALPRLRLLTTVLPPFAAFLILLFWMRPLIAPSFAFVDNPAVYENLIADNQTVQELQNGYVRYSGDGSALYILPRAGIRFSNTGVEIPDFHPYENVDEYYESLLRENASFVLIYMGSPEEEYLIELDFPLVYSRENLRIYEVPR